MSTQIDLTVEPKVLEETDADLGANEMLENEEDDPDQILEKHSLQEIKIKMLQRNSRQASSSFLFQRQKEPTNFQYQLTSSHFFQNQRSSEMQQMRKIMSRASSTMTGGFLRQDDSD